MFNWSPVQTHCSLSWAFWGTLRPSESTWRPRRLPKALRGSLRPYEFFWGHLRHFWGYARLSEALWLMIFPSDLKCHRTWNSRGKSREFSRPYAPVCAFVRRSDGKRLFFRTTRYDRSYHLKLISLKDTLNRVIDIRGRYFPQFDKTDQQMNTDFHRNI